MPGAGIQLLNARERMMYRHALKIALISSALMLMNAGTASAEDENHIRFNMVVSKGASTCLPDATGIVQVASHGNAEDMYVIVWGLPPNTDFDLFVIQVPNAPFGLAWYQGDLHSDDEGVAIQHVRGIFSVETFTVAPNAASAPAVFAGGQFPDAATNPAFNPIQMYHLGLWFDSPADAQQAGCSGAVTPFNGQHNAGIQVLNTSNFPDTAGPLSQLTQ
jgi:hypothetical protein